MAPAANENVVVSSSNRKLEKMLSMKGGKGEGSYVNNSQAQGQHARSMLPLLKQCLDGIQLFNINAGDGDGQEYMDNNNNISTLPFVVADLGCSCGTNTINIIEIIIHHITKRYESMFAGGGSVLPEFSAFFSDLPSNDFNTLFQLLPPYYGGGGGSMEDCRLASDNHHRPHRSYFAAGVPGSFYRRLFPAKSVDFFYSAFSLHWLSQVPETVMDKKSSAYNKGRIFIHKGKEETAKEYKKQFQTDLGGFLRSRFVEMKLGGCMFLVCLGRTTSDPTNQCGAGLLFATHFQDAWDDLVHEGLISSEKRDNFNIPVYAPSIEDFKEVVEEEGRFNINRMELFRGGSPLVLNHPDDAAEVGRGLANICRSVSGVLVDAHIGDHLSEELFSRVEKRAKEHAKDILENLQFFHIVASLSLKKKDNSSSHHDHNDHHL